MRSPPPPRPSRSRTLAIAALVAMTAMRGRAAAATVHPQIIGGEADLTAGAVGALLEVGRGRAAHLGCSGTLIAADVILTAAHCAKYLTPPLGFTLAPVAVDDGSAVHAVGAVYIHPQFVVTADPVPLHDIALMALAEPIAGVVPERLAEVNDAIAVGEQLEIIGYGALTAGGATGTRARGTASVTTIAASELTIGNAGDPHGCAGDSGGPALAGVEGQRRIVGVLSRGADGDTDCGPGGVIYTRVDAHGRWIDDTLAQLHAPPGGCAVAPGRGPAPTALPLIVVALAMASRVRRRARCHA
jgi:MYXO-CTERM domain-containing protein